MRESEVHCRPEMNILNIRCQNFRELDSAQKDQLLAELINQIQSLESEISMLRENNRKHQETVDWMHQIIWDLVKKQRLIEDTADR